MTKAIHSPFPTETQKLLLQASLLNGDKALDAWQKWKVHIDFEKDIEHGSFRQLPLLYHNLHKLNIDDKLMFRLKGIYRQSWSKNHILFFKTGEVLKLLNKAGVRTLVMKGIALTVLIYKNYSIRPMADMDILVPHTETTKTIDLLKKHGWIPQKEEYLEHNLKYGRSLTFIDAEKTELDLHWHPIFESHDTITDADFWDKANQFEVAGVPTLAFCDTDSLFHTIVHGLRYNPEPPIRWVADSMALLNKNDNGIDWDRLVDHCKKFRVSLQMLDAFSYLIKYFDAQIPEKAIIRLKALKSSFFDKLVYRHAKKYGDIEPFTFFEKLYSIYAAYVRQSSKTGFIRINIGFIRYIIFRNKGKPYFRILLYYMSLVGRNRTSKRNKQ
ncbi:MAG: nucleotidyltransferase family protein [Bacteroidota bacterium]|nr:nucleotidyltransferase family protein [Bacteroidota bacterium]